MSGEIRLVRGALRAGCAAAVPAAGAAYLVRGADAAISVLLAVGIVLTNAAAAALLSAGAARLSPVAAAMISMPSFAVRMAAILTALGALQGRPFVDPAVFAVTFALAVVAVIALESVAWRRTPWLALTLEEKA